MAEFVLRGLLSDIRSSRWFTIIADEATDISCGEQMCVAIRWADNNYEIHNYEIHYYKYIKHHQILSGRHCLILNLKKEF